VAKINNIGKKRIPTLLGLIVLVAGLGAGLFLVGRATIVPRATAEETPKQIKITNISENSFSVSWVTDVSTIGFVRFGEAAGKLEQTIADDRDQLSGEAGIFATHHVTLKNLKPDTKYYFKLGSGTSRVLYDNSGAAYAIATPAVLSTPPAADTAYGTIRKSETIPAEGALVYLTLPNATPLSTVAQSDGNWAVSLSTARSEDLGAYVAYDRQATVLEIFVQSGEGQTATAVTVTGNDAPVAPIVLGQAHDFTSEAGGLSDGVGIPGDLPPRTEVEEENEEDGKSKFSLLPLGKALPAVSTFELEILNPEEEGEKIATQKPEIFGTSPKNVTLSITVESPTTYTDEVEVGSDGLWQWSPPANLESGEHTVSVSYTDENGLLQQIKRSFVVLAAGEGDLPAFEATPSAAQTGGQATPSASASPSAAPRVSQPSTTSGMPTAGVLTPTLVVFILGAGLLAAGVFWQLRWK